MMRVILKEDPFFPIPGGLDVDSVLDFDSEPGDDSSSSKDSPGSGSNYKLNK